MTTKEHLEQLLDALVSSAVFEIPDLGIVRAPDAKAFYRRRQSAPMWVLADENALRVDGALLSALTGNLSSLLAEFTNPDSGRIGNGLFGLTGGLITRATLLPEEFAKMMVVAATRLGVQRASTHLFHWIDGAPLRTKHHILVEGIRIDQPIRVRGVELGHRVANAELPSSLLHRTQRPEGFSAQRIQDAAVVSLDLEHQPALYKPDEDTASLSLGPRKTVPVNASLSRTSDGALCEAMMLACGRHVAWLASWATCGDLDAFMSNRGGGGFFPANPVSAAATAEFTNAHLASSIDICTLREQVAESGDGRLDLAIRRWTNSIARRRTPDKLIELRVALEALYARKGERSLAAGIALRGAWHLGRTFAERVEYRDLLRKAYADASSVIHAGEPKHASRDRSLLERYQEACREAILKILRKGSPDWDHIVLGG